MNDDERRMVRIKFKGKKLKDLDFWTKSDPFLELSRPNFEGDEWIKVNTSI